MFNESNGEVTFTKRKVFTVVNRRVSLNLLLNALLLEATKPTCKIIHQKS